MTSLLGATTRLAQMRHEFSGTLLLLFQPAEEAHGGAQLMVQDGLYKRIGHVPDVLLGQHVWPRPAGTLGFVPGVQLSAADSLRITMHGKGGHASEPARCIDPVLMAAAAIQRLQGVVAREVQPGVDFAVVTVGAVRAGAADNVIPDSAELRVNVRSVDTAVRKKVLDAISRIVRAEAQASGAVQEPDIESVGSFPVTDNDAALSEVLGRTFKDVFGDDFQPENFPRANGSEDFSNLAAEEAEGVPYVYWFFGGTDPKLFEDEDEGKEEKKTEEKDIPINHSPYFAPVMQPTLKVAIDAMTAAALTFLRE